MNYEENKHFLFDFAGKMDLEAKNTLEWYKGRSVFITGATGFMGKVLIEKLLYSYADMKNIYILIRSKRGRSIEQRIEDMWKLPVKKIKQTLHVLRLFLVILNILRTNFKEFCSTQMRHVECN